jgi:CRISPR-associated protein Csd1
LVTADEDNTAFHSYGLKQALIAPTCRSCAERYGRTINRLVERTDTHLAVGPVVYLFWSRDDSWSPASLLATPEPDEVRTLLASAFGSDRAALSTDTAPFYATAFSASGARVVVRDWLETTVPRAKASLARYFALQRIVGEWGEADAPPLALRGYFTEGIRPGWREGLAESVVPPRQGRRETQKLSAAVPQALLHLALAGGPLPAWVMQQAVQRNRAEQGIPRSRAALIKMVLLSQTPHEENAMVQLDPDNRDAAYLCGRLLAVLEALQRVAIPGTKATITDRYFGTASSAPASVFGRLLRGSQAHLGKLRKDAPGTYDAIQQKLEAILSGMQQTFPRLLTQEQQGMFSLGYYHQRAADRAAARQARERSRAAI